MILDQGAIDLLIKEEFQNVGGYLIDVQSNCSCIHLNYAARNFHLQALKQLKSSNVKIDSYCSCLGNRNGNGTTPVVVGAPIIQYFALSPGSILHVKELTDVELVVKTMKQLAENLIAYNDSLRQ
ncbi:hypothetical protein Ccrd_010787, partial [Cynara cardunculus var. scolymus]